jgi:FMN phosphatase YigB (HAD superfamily)
VVPVFHDRGVPAIATTLLLDLDDTLLDTNMEAFAPAYFSALAAALADVASSQVVLTALMAGTKAMMENSDPGRTLRQVFDSVFFPSLGGERADLDGRIEQFYDRTFPNLKELTHPRPDAVAFVEWALNAGFRIGIATNPYFPLKAVHHRLRWAGLPPEKYPFTLISSYESFHFIKETGAYFLEFLGQLGWPDGGVIMVGNDLNMDLIPAMRAGLSVFWVRQGGDAERSDIPQGSFPNLRSWLESSPGAQHVPKIETPPAILSALSATPAVLGAWVDALPEKAWERRVSPLAPTPVEIISHLCRVEKQNNLPFWQKLVSEQEPFLPAERPEAHGGRRTVEPPAVRQALSRFVEARKASLACLPGDASQWTRPARDACSGSTTVLQLAQRMAAEDRTALQQIHRAMAGGGS